MWPLGKLLVFGSRTGTPAFEIRRSVRSGRSRPTTCLMPALTRCRGHPGDAQGPDGGPPGRTRPPAPPHGHAGPEDPVVAEAGDHLGGGIDRRTATQRLEQLVDPVVDGIDQPRGARIAPRRRRRRTRGRSCRPLVRGRRWRGGPARRGGPGCRGRRRPGTGRRRRRGRSRGTGRTGTAARSGAGSPRHGRPVRWPAHTARVLVRCPRSPCSVGSAVITVGSPQVEQLDLCRAGARAPPGRAVRRAVRRPVWPARRRATGPVRSCSR